MSSSFPDEDVLDYIFSLLESNRDRNTVSLVCKYWYKVESSGRKKVVIQNCYALSPLRLISRFPKVRDLTLNTTYGTPDHITGQPFDEGYEAIVRSCKKLKHLSLSGLITDQVLPYIGMYAEQLETLTVEFSRQSDIGILYVLNGCSKLTKLVIMNSRIGDAELLAAADKYERLQFFLLSSCNVTLEGCKALAKKVPKLNIEILKDTPIFDDGDVKMMYKIYVYRSLDGPRNDAPGYVCTFG